jgi:hypothetical protein
MTSLSRRLTVIPGYIGAVVFAVGSLIAGAAYVGRWGQRYSPFNHFVSELGNTTNSELHAVFNVALFICGSFFAVFMVGVGLRFTGWMRWIIAVGGAIAGICGALVGVFPMDVDLPSHGNVALGFFEGSLALLVVFALVVGLSRRRVYPRWLALAALPMIVSNAIFVYLVLEAGPQVLAASNGNRPDFWIVAMSEWGVMVFLMMWVVLLARWRQTRLD